MTKNVKALTMKKKNVDERNIYIIFHAPLL